LEHQTFRAIQLSVVLKREMTDDFFINILFVIYDIQSFVLVDKILSKTYIRNKVSIDITELRSIELDIFQVDVFVARLDCEFYHSARAFNFRVYFTGEFK